MAAFDSTVAETQSRMAELKADIKRLREQHLHQLFQKQKIRIQFKIMTRDIKIHQQSFIKKVIIPGHPTLNLPHSPPPILPVETMTQSTSSSYLSSIFSSTTLRVTTPPSSPFRPPLFLPTLSISHYPISRLTFPPIPRLQQRPPVFCRHSCPARTRPSPIPAPPPPPSTPPVPSGPIPAPSIPSLPVALFPFPPGPAPASLPCASSPPPLQPPCSPPPTIPLPPIPPVRLRCQRPPNQPAPRCSASRPVTPAALSCAPPPPSSHHVPPPLYPPPNHPPCPALVPTPTQPTCSTLFRQPSCLPNRPVLQTPIPSSHPVPPSLYPPPHHPPWHAPVPTPTQPTCSALFRQPPYPAPPLTPLQPPCPPLSLFPSHRPPLSCSSAYAHPTSLLRDVPASRSVPPAVLSGQPPCPASRHVPSHYQSKPPTPPILSPADPHSQHPHLLGAAVLMLPTSPLPSAIANSCPIPFPLQPPDPAPRTFPAPHLPPCSTPFPTKAPPILQLYPPACSALLRLPPSLVMLTALLCQLPYPAIPKIFVNLLPYTFIILNITTYNYMFVNPQGVEPQTPNLCWWHPAWFLLHPTVFTFSSIVPLPSACLSPPFQPPCPFHGHVQPAVLLR